MKVKCPLTVAKALPRFLRDQSTTGRGSKPRGKKASFLLRTYLLVLQRRWHCDRKSEGFLVSRFCKDMHFDWLRKFACVNLSLTWNTPRRRCPNPGSMVNHSWGPIRLLFRNSEGFSEAFLACNYKHLCENPSQQKTQQSNRIVPLKSGGTRHLRHSRAETRGWTQTNKHHVNNIHSLQVKRK